jgi:hypothetical protein
MHSRVQFIRKRLPIFVDFECIHALTLYCPCVAPLQIPTETELSGSPWSVISIHMPEK